MGGVLALGSAGLLALLWWRGYLTTWIEDATRFVGGEPPPLVPFDPSRPGLPAFRPSSITGGRAFGGSW